LLWKNLRQRDAFRVGRDPKPPAYDYANVFALIDGEVFNK
jgi:hypothetical protein